MKKIIVVIPLNDQQKNRMTALADELSAEIQFCPVEIPETQLKRANIIVGNISPELLPAAEALELLQLNSAGYDRYTGAGIVPEGVSVCNATGAYGLALSEHMLAMLLSLIKNLPAYHSNQLEHVWQDAGNVRSIWNSRTLVLGMGNIGGEFAKRMHALGSTVVGMKRTVTEVPDYCEAVYTFDHLDEQLALADYVACAMPDTPDTRNLFDLRRYQLMKPDAILINVGRGTLTDPALLAQVLNKGIIGGACVDVANPEPLPADNPLWRARNCIITPHIAGDYHLAETKERILAIAEYNIRATCSGATLKNRVI